MKVKIKIESIEHTCLKCWGNGKVKKKICADCNGIGTVRVQRIAGF